MREVHVVSSLESGRDRQAYLPLSPLIIVPCHASIHTARQGTNAPIVSFDFLSRHTLESFPTPLRNVAEILVAIIAQGV